MINIKSFFRKKKNTQYYDLDFKLPVFYFINEKLEFIKDGCNIDENFNDINYFLDPYCKMRKTTYDDYDDYIICVYPYFKEICNNFNEKYIKLLNKELNYNKSFEKELIEFSCFIEKVDNLYKETKSLRKKEMLIKNLNEEKINISKKIDKIQKEAEFLCKKYLNLNY